jgi:transmembrane sensor
MKAELLSRFLNGQCSPEELDTIKRWIEENEVDPELEALIESQWEKLNSSGEVTQSHHNLLAKIHARVGKSEKPKQVTTDDFNDSADSGRQGSFYLKIAASVILCACSVWFAFDYFTKRSVATIAEASVITHKTAVGEKLTVVLPDSTIVILNSSSSLEYQSSFAGETRSVTVSGEAFFDVTHDASRPFIVTTGEIQTTVLGTKFNVTNKKGVVHVALAQGKVRLTSQNSRASVMLVPGQMGSSDNANGKFEVKDINIDELIAWKEAMVTLKSTSLKEVLADLEKWYGVTITVDKSIDQQKKLSGKFNNENLNNILSGLSFSLGFQFAISSDTITLTKK